MSGLIPPDVTRCQADIPNGYTFMTLGGSPGYRRCDNEPVVIAVENRPGKDGLKGSMSLCQRCKAELVRQLGADYATFAVIDSQPR